MISSLSSCRLVAKCTLTHIFVKRITVSNKIVAVQEHPELLPLIQRKFRSAGDVDTAQRLVFDSRGLQRARELAAQHASLAVRAVRLLRLAHGTTSR